MAVPEAPCLRVRVYSDPVGPAPGADVEVRDSRGASHEATSGIDGVASFAGLPPGPFFAVARRGESIGIWHEPLDEGWCLPSGRATEVDVLLAPRRRMAGTVVREEDGVPVAGATIEVWIERWWSWRGPAADPFTSRPGPWPRGVVTVGDDGLLPVSGGRIAAAGSGPDGAFDVSGPDECIVLVARTPGRAAVGIDAGSDGEGPFEIRLPPSGTLRGTVRGQDGKPVEGASVLAFPADAGESLRAPELGRRDWHSPSSPVVPVARTDTAGRYRIEEVPADQGVILVADKAGFGRSAPVEDAWIPGPGDVVVKDLRIERWSRVAVRWSGPVAPAPERLEVSLVPAGVARPDAVPMLPGTDGSFARDAVPPGKWLVRAVSLREFLT